MDEAKWERAMMQGQASINPNWFPRPKLEIPNIEPTTPRRQGTSAQSPRGIYDFPISPQSPGEGMVLSPPIKTIPMKTIPRSMWIAQDNYIDLVPNCTEYSPRSNHPGHGFGDCNAECNSNSRDSDNGNKTLGHKSNLSPSLNQGDNVLVRCNKSKWLAGQVKCVLSTSIKVWIGAVETLVNVPVELFPTHIVRMESPTCSSPSECYTTRLHHTQHQIKARVQCVRPAHLSHRQLFQVISPNNSVPTSSQQMCQVQCPSPTSTNSKTKCETNTRCTPIIAPNPPNLFEHIASLEKNGIIPPKRCTQQQRGTYYEQLNTTREDSNPQEALFNSHKGFANLQAQYNWRLHMYQTNQQGNRPSYSRPSTLPMLNVNLNNEGTPSSNSPFLLGKNCNNYHHIKTSPQGSPQQLYNINQEPPIHASYEDSRESTLYKLHYEQFVAPQMVTKSTMTNFGDTKSPKRPPTPPPQLLTKGMMDLRDNKSPKRPPIPSHVKGKEICEDQECPSWAKGTDFHQILESNQGMSLERSVSLDSFKPPNFPGLVDPRSRGARPSKNATSSAIPTWMTVIDNGHNTCK